jgi:hypothetical protein
MLGICREISFGVEFCALVSGVFLAFFGGAVVLTLFRTFKVLPHAQIRE